MVDGLRPKAIALRTKNLLEALPLAIELKHRQAVSNHPHQLSKEIERYLAARLKAGEHTLNTQRITAIDLGLFCEWLGDPIAGSVTEKHIEAWRHHMIEKGNKSSTVSVKMRRAQGCFAWLEKQQRITRNPFKKVKIPTVKRSKGITFCTREQRDQLIAACDREDLLFILMAGFYLGLRIGEILEAVPSWFRTPGLVEVAETPTFKPKDKESRIIHYGDRFAEFLENYGMREPFMLRPDVKHGNYHWRWNCTHAWHDLTKPLELRWVTFHILRHTFATLHVQAGTPLATVARWLGDSVEITFQHYAAYAPTDSHIRNLD